jgi:hypothetical protein
MLPPIERQRVMGNLMSSTLHVPPDRVTAEAGGRLAERELLGLGGILGKRYILGLLTPAQPSLTPARPWAEPLPLSRQ